MRTHRSGTIQHRVASLSAQSDRARRPAATLSLSDLTKNLPQNKSVRTVLRRNFMEVNEEYLAVLSALNGHFSEQYVAMIAVCVCVCVCGCVCVCVCVWLCVWLRVCVSPRSKHSPRCRRTWAQQAVSTSTRVMAGCLRLWTARTRKS